MAQQWKDVLTTQIVEHMYEDVDEDWFINMLVRENASIAIVKHEHPIHGGFRLGRSPNLPRDRQLGHHRIYPNYFYENLVYDGRLFRSRYKMKKKLFKKIMDTLLSIFLIGKMLWVCMVYLAFKSALQHYECLFTD
jgi:hypothetical protein